MKKDIAQCLKDEDMQGLMVLARNYGGVDMSVFALPERLRDKKDVNTAMDALKAAEGRYMAALKGDAPKPKAKPKKKVKKPAKTEANEEE